MGLKEWLEDEYDDGKEAGRKEVLTSQVAKKLEKGHTPEEIAEILETDIKAILEIVEKLQK